jgi:hypothetical protein
MAIPKESRRAWGAPGERRSASVAVFRAALALPSVSGAGSLWVRVPVLALPAAWVWRGAWVSVSARPSVSVVE